MPSVWAKTFPDGIVLSQKLHSVRDLGIQITEPTVAKYMVRHRKPPSQTWRTFLDNHLKTLVSVDFFVVPTVRFQILYVFLVLATTGGAFSTL